MKNIKNKFLLLSLLLVLLLTPIYASGVNAVLLSQDPDPVAPGNYVYANVKISNSDNSDVVNDVSVEYIPNKNIQIAPDSDSIKKIGTLTEYSTTQSSLSYALARFKLLVSEDTPLGLNKISFKVKAENSVYTFDFDLLVKDANPLLDVESIDVDTIEPGKSNTLKLKIKNNNNLDLQNVKISLDLDNVDEKILSLVKGSNQIVIPVIKSMEEKELNFGIIVSPDASSKPYLLPIDISYDDTLGNSYTDNIFGTVKVYSTPELSLKLDSQTVYTKGNSGKFTLAIANPGTSSIKGTQIDILKDDSYEIISGDSQYVGDLNPDDYQTVQSEIYFKTDNPILKIKVTYGDSYNERKEENLEIPLKVYSSDVLSSLGISGKSSFSVMDIVLLLVIAGIIYYLGKKFHQSRKAKARVRIKI